MKIFKRLSICAFALVSVFAMTGCSTGTLIESPSLEVKQALDTSITNMQTSVTDYKITGSMTLSVQNPEMNANVVFNIDSVVSGTGLEQKAHMNYSASGNINEQTQQTSMSVNNDYYMSVTESHYNLYETKSRTTTTKDTLSSALSLIALESNIKDIVELDYLGTFSGANAYSSDDYKLYSLNEDSYRIELDTQTGSLDNTSISYKKITATITITEGKITQIKVTSIDKSRANATAVWGSNISTKDYTIEYGSFTITLPNVTNYTAVSYNTFPTYGIF